MCRQFLTTRKTQEYYARGSEKERKKFVAASTVKDARPKTVNKISGQQSFFPTLQEPLYLDNRTDLNYLFYTLSRRFRNKAQPHTRLAPETLA